MNHCKVKDKSAEAKMMYNPGGDKQRSKKESNRAAARRSRLKKKKLQDHNNEIRKKLLEANSRLILENNVLKDEVKRLNMLLECHRNCPNATDEYKRVVMEAPNVDTNSQSSNDLSLFPYSVTESPILPFLPPKTGANNKIYKILSVNPLEVNKASYDVSRAHSKAQKINSLQQQIISQANLPSVQTSHITTLDADNSQVIDLSFNEAEGSSVEVTGKSKTVYNSKKRSDILVQAMSQLDDKYSSTKVPMLKSKNNRSFPGSDTDSNSHSEELVVQGSPGFVRVTSKSISVRQPLAKKMKRFVFGKTLSGIGTTSTTSNDTEI